MFFGPCWEKLTTTVSDGVSLSREQDWDWARWQSFLSEMSTDGDQTEPLGLSPPETVGSKMLVTSLSYTYISLFINVNSV